MSSSGREKSRFKFPLKLPTAPITIYLIVATAVALLPLMILSIVLLSRLESGRQNNTINRSMTDAKFIARNIDQQFSGMDSTLRLLSSLSELKREDFAGFQTIANRALAGSEYHSLILSLDGTKILDTSLQSDLLPFFATVSTELSKLLQQHQSDLKGFTYDSMTRSWMYYTGSMLPSDTTQMPSALLLIMPEKGIRDLLAPEFLYNSWSAALVDENSTIIATSKTEGITSKAPVLTNEVEEALAANQGTAIVDQTIYIKVPVPNRSWSVLVTGPLKPETNIVSQAFTYLALGTLLIVLLTVVIGYLVSKHLHRAVRDLSTMAAEVGEGKVVPPIETQIYEFDLVARTLTTASYDRHLAQEKSEIILQELVHRSKNTITLLQAIMRQLAKEATSVEAYHKSLDQRLRGFAKSISELAVVEWSGLDLPKFVASHLEVFGDLTLRIDAQGPALTISPAAGQNLGLIIHELMTNSIKHGALSQDIGTASIRWCVAPSDTSDGEERFIMTWQDEGTSPCAEKTVTGFGSTIIVRHAEYAFSGSVKITYDQGHFLWQLNCPAKNVLESRPSSIL